MRLRKRDGRDRRVPVRLVAGGWPRWLQHGPLRRLFVHDPAAVVRPDVTDEDFQRAMYGLHIGGTVKITWPGRQREVDRLLIDTVDLDQAWIVELGASDGSTAHDLITALGDRFARYTITDRYLRVSWVRDGRRVMIFRDGRCILISTPRLVWWPQLSPVVDRLARRLIRRTAGTPTAEVILLNPTVRRLIESDPRIDWAEHDVFLPWPGEQRPDVIKIGNLLRRVYFSDADISRALRAVHAGLREGGHLYLTDHLRAPEAGGLYRKTAEGFVLVSATQRLPEIHHLVCRPIAGGD